MDEFLNGVVVGDTQDIWDEQQPTIANKMYEICVHMTGCEQVPRVVPTLIFGM